MKKLLTILCLVLLVSCSDEPPLEPSSEPSPEPPPEVPYEVPSHRLINNGGMTFEIGSNDPFTGVSTEYHENGQPEEKIYYKNGREVSTTEFNYYENGQIQGRGHIKDGELYGLMEIFHENGQLQLRVNFKNGKEDGLLESYYENGELEFREKFPVFRAETHDFLKVLR